jgi:hypothetical protein
MSAVESAAHQRVRPGLSPTGGLTPSPALACGPSAKILDATASAVFSRRRKDEYDSLLLVSEIRSCRVSYQDSDGIRHSVEVTAETLYEAAVLGIKALQLANWSSAPIMIDITVRAPETTHTIKTTALSSWLSGHGRSPREQMLKVRLRQLLGQ